MRQVVFTEFFIFSAHKKGLSVNENHKRSRELWNVLTDLGANFVNVGGCYKGSKEQSIMLLDGNEETVKELCGLYDQESYLHRSADNSVLLKMLEGEIIELGEPLVITQNELNDFESYTILPQKNGTNLYFTFKKVQ